MSEVLQKQTTELKAQEATLKAEVANLLEILKAKKYELKLISKAVAYNEKLTHKFESGEPLDEETENDQ